MLDRRVEPITVSVSRDPPDEKLREEFEMKPSAAYGRNTVRERGDRAKFLAKVTAATAASKRVKVCRSSCAARRDEDRGISA